MVPDVLGGTCLVRDVVSLRHLLWCVTCPCGEPLMVVTLCPWGHLLWYVTSLGAPLMVRDVSLWGTSYGSDVVSLGGGTSYGT